MDHAPPSPGDKLRSALELFESGLELMRRNLRRRHPDAAQEELERLLSEWLRTRPGAELGNSPGHPRSFSEPAA